jgi:hypothetical protein
MRIGVEDGLGERLERCFTRGSGHGLLQLGAGEAGTSLPSSLAWWRDFAIRFVTDLCALGETAEADERRLPAPAASDLTALIDEAPPMQGGEYLQLDGAPSTPPSHAGSSGARRTLISFSFRSPVRTAENCRDGTIHRRNRRRGFLGV